MLVFLRSFQTQSIFEDVLKIIQDLHQIYREKDGARNPSSISSIICSLSMLYVFGLDNVIVNLFVLFGTRRLVIVVFEFIVSSILPSVVILHKLSLCIVSDTICFNIGLC